MSRSIFAAKFSSLVGAPPLTYLTRWRLWQASRLLAEGNLSVGETALRVGYESEAAFSKAFKRHFGQSTIPAALASAPFDKICANRITFSPDIAHLRPNVWDA